MPEPRYRARREPQPRRSDPRSGTRVRMRPASEGRSPTSRRQDPRRRRRRSRTPLALLAIVLVAALGGISAAALTLRAPATAKSSAATSGATAGSAGASAAVGRSKNAHAKRQACDDCHESPAPSHYRAECSTCHAPSRPFSEPKLTHPVFGAHTVATHSCDACHRPDPPSAGKANEANETEKPENSPSCRACHRNKCGKGVTTMAGCLKCHQKGTTDGWVRSATP